MIIHQDRIVVTGGAGFLGRHVVEELSKRGYSNLYVPRSSSCNLIDVAQVHEMYRVYRPKAVIHLAAEVGGIGANQANPGRYFYANMAMGMNLIEGARVNGLHKLIQVGTVCAYPKHTPVPFTEDNLWAGYPEETNAPYGVAKRALLTMCQAYRQQYGLNAIYLMPVNLYGPWDNFDLNTSHVIPALIRKFDRALRRNQKEVVLWGTGTPSREFLYVEDCAQAIVSALELYDSPEPMNLGSGVEIPIASLAEMIGKLVGFNGIIQWDRSKPDGQPRRCLDVSQAAKQIGFNATTSLRDGLMRTIEYYRSLARAADHD